MKPKLKAPGTMRLKLKYRNLLSSFAFNLNLRRCTKVGEEPEEPFMFLDLPAPVRAKPEPPKKKGWFSYFTSAATTTTTTSTLTPLNRDLPRTRRGSYETSRSDRSG